ncbi:glycosyl transferase family group 2-domain-containing protein [Sparassis latifolia]
MDYDAYDALLHHIFRQTQEGAWFKPSLENVHAGVCLRVDSTHFRVFPYDNHYLAPFEEAVKIINPVVAVKVRNAAIHAALGTVKEDEDSIFINEDTRIQILNTMLDLPRADREQCAAFIRDERVLVVWSYNLENIVPTCADFEEKLIALVWKRRTAFSSIAGSTSPSNEASDASLTEKVEAVVSEQEMKEKVEQKENAKKSAPGLKLGFLTNYFVTEKHDVEKTAEGPSPRPIRLFAPVYGGLASALSIFFIASGISILLQESVLDGSYTRFALIVTVPFLFCVSIVSLIGPVAQYHENSKYYSAVRPAPNKLVDSNLPHITVEMPVYKESLKDTISPSVYSLKKAMQTYARQGGTSSIFVHDDGLQLISEADRAERVAFYADHNIGWVARPPHSSEPDGFKRAGRFKKASNMNYGLALSLKLEKHLLALEADAAARGETPDPRAGGESLEDRAMNMAVEEIFEESGRRWKPWASNGKSIRVGEIILMVDSDTIVPEDCLRDAARELAESPEVAILQHESDVMQVAYHYFENGIAHFTRRINKCISMSCANGEVAPFVGHNAFLRWSAVQDASFVDPDDGVKKIWSESNVSEDFDMALRLQLKGYIIRWSTYSLGGFKEGVSLTCDDELNRWQKYSYGCNELIFNPFIHWWHLGPINKQLRTFIWSAAPVHYKISMLAYGIAAAAALSVMNYLLLGWNITTDGFYEHSFEIWLACMVVFPCAGNVGFTLLEYRLGLRSIFSSAIENFTWVPFFFFFFGGLSIHLSQALLAHLFSYNIQWGATKKEVERSNFWKEVPKILKRFWLAFVLSIVMCVGMIILTTPVIPVGWQVSSIDWAVILPMAINAGCHILFPIVLNPWLMIFSY